MSQDCIKSEAVSECTVIAQHILNHHRGVGFAGIGKYTHRLSVIVLGSIVDMLLSGHEVASEAGLETESAADIEPGIGRAVHPEVLYIDILLVENLQRIVVQQLAASLVVASVRIDRAVPRPLLESPRDQ